MRAILDGQSLLLNLIPYGGLGLVVSSERDAVVAKPRDAVDARALSLKEHS